MKGSRRCCLELTSGPRAKVAAALTRLTGHYAIVTPLDIWMPRGFADPDEARLRESRGFLCEKQRESVTDWWLAVAKGANTPNWDIASTCTIDGREGLLIVEAKAHEREISDAAKRKPGSPNGDRNDARIRDAVGQANDALNAIMPGWSLSCDSHYQLSNRFAWAWKIARLGKPVVLVYLGFLNCREMDGPGRTILTSLGQWRRCVLKHSERTVPQDAWELKINVSGTSLIPIIRAADVSVSAQ